MQPIASLRPGQRAAVMGEIKSTQLAVTRRRGFKIFHAIVGDASGAIRCSWMNQAYLADVIAPRATVVIFGDVKLDSSGLHFLNPEFELVSDDLAALHVGRIVPFYERTGTVTPNMQRRLVRQVLDDLPHQLPDLLPDDLRTRRRLMDRRLALEGAHFPAGEERVEDLNAFRSPAQRRLIFEEFFLYQLAFACFTSGFALFAERRFTWQGHPFTPREIGFTYAFGALVGLVVQGGLIGRLVKRFGEAKLVISGLVTLGVGYAALGHVEPVAGLLVAIGLGSFGNAVLRPALTSLLSQSVEKEEQGAALGIFQSLASLAAITAAPLSGWLIDRQHLQAWGWMAGIFCLLGLAASRFGSGLKSST